MNSIPSPANRRPFFRRIRARVFPLLLAGPLVAATGSAGPGPDAREGHLPGSLLRRPRPSSASTTYPRCLRRQGLPARRDLAQGLGLWVTDDTAGGTPLSPRRPRRDRAGADVNGTFFFSATSPEGNWLCKSDGTVAGTSFVRRFSDDDFTRCTCRGSRRWGASSSSRRTTASTAEPLEERRHRGGNDAREGCSPPGAFSSFERPHRVRRRRRRAPLLVQREPGLRSLAERRDRSRDRPARGPRLRPPASST